MHNLRASFLDVVIFVQLGLLLEMWCKKPPFLDCN